MPQKSPQSILAKISAVPVELSVLVLLAFFLSFDRFPTYEAAGLSVKISTVLGLVAILCALKQAAGGGVRQYKKLKLFIPLVLWILWLGVGLLWAADYSAFLRAFLPLAFLAVLSMSIAVLWKPQYMAPVIKSLLLGAVVAIGFGVFQFVGNFLGIPDTLTLIRPEYAWQGFGFPRMHSFTLEPLYFAGFLLLPVSILLARSIKRQRIPSWYVLVLLVAGISAVILTLSRSGIAGLVVVFLVVGIMLRKNVKQIISWRLIGGMALGFVLSILVVAGTIAVFNRQGYDSDLTYGQRGISTFIAHLTNTRFFANEENKEKDDSIAQRDTARSQAIEVVKESPITVLRGLGTGQHEYHTKAKYGLDYKGEPNNMLIEQLIQGGLIGLALLLAFFFNLLRRLYQRRAEWLAVALAAYIVAILAQAQTFHGLLITHLWFAAGLAAAVTIGYSRSDSAPAGSGHPRKSQ